MMIDDLIFEIFFLWGRFTQIYGWINCLSHFTIRLVSMGQLYANISSLTFSTYWFVCLSKKRMFWIRSLMRNFHDLGWRRSLRLVGCPAESAAKISKDVMHLLNKYKSLFSSNKDNSLGHQKCVLCTVRCPDEATVV